MLGLLFLLFAILLGLSAVFLNQAAADAPDGLNRSSQNVNLISECHLLYPDDEARIETCISNAP